MAAWWHLRHPFVPDRLFPEFARSSPSARLSVRLAVRLTVRLCIHRVLVREGCRVRRSGETQGCMARRPVVVLRRPLWPCTRGRVALAAPVGGRALGRGTRRLDLRADRSADRIRAWNHEPCGSWGVRTTQRGLSLAQHLDPGAARVTHV